MERLVVAHVNYTAAEHIARCLSVKVCLDWLVTMTGLRLGCGNWIQKIAHDDGSACMDSSWRIRSRIDGGDMADAVVLEYQRMFPLMEMVLDVVLRMRATARVTELPQRFGVVRLYMSGSDYDFDLLLAALIRVVIGESESSYQSRQKRKKKFFTAYRC